MSNKIHLHLRAAAGHSSTANRLHELKEARGERRHWNRPAGVPKQERAHVERTHIERAHVERLSSVGLDTYNLSGSSFTNNSSVANKLSEQYSADILKYLVSCALPAPTAANSYTDHRFTPHDQRRGGGDGRIAGPRSRVETGAIDAATRSGSPPASWPDSTTSACMSTSPSGRTSTRRWTTKWPSTISERPTTATSSASDGAARVQDRELDADRTGVRGGPERMGSCVVDILHESCQDSAARRARAAGRRTTRPSLHGWCKDDASPRNTLYGPVTIYRKPDPTDAGGQ